LTAGEGEMKKFTKRVLQIVAVLIILLIIVNWNRFSGAYFVYDLADDFSTQLKEGNDDLNFRLDASWGEEKERNHLAATVSYQRDLQFTADVIYGDNRFVITSGELATQVDIIKKSLRISSEGSSRKNFDLFLILAEILRNHPATRAAASLSFFDKTGLAAWAFFNCDFSDDGTYQNIEIPEDALGLKLTVKVNENGKEILVNAQTSDTDIESSLHWDDYEPLPDRSGFIPDSEILVNRKELNRAVYRGSLRAAGILLENAIPPPVDTTEIRSEHGLLTYVNQNRVLIARGTPAEIGYTHGKLLKGEIRKMIDATLYTVGWAYTIERKHWFIDDMRDAYQRLEPFIPERFQQEMAALADTTGFSPEEIRLTNVFPALFHCSGFALFGEATQGGVLLHGRVLDYMTGIGLQHHAVVFVIQPEGANAFVNIGYAGFIGSVSGMNDKQVAFGEMGGRGEGDWDGMPMAFLMRDGLEKANSLDEALAIFRDTPRTCEYYYVISDGKIPDARGLSTSPERFEVIKPNQFHEQLPHPQKDAVLMSAGDRYEKLAERVKDAYGKFDAETAIHLMDRPVAMKSNLHDVLFAPQTLEFWVANAGSYTPAAQEPYTHYVMKDLLSKLE
jgi:hypothetical protein